MITPEQMARIYISRAGRGGIGEVKSLLKNFKESQAATAYWERVLEILTNKYAR